MEILTGESHGLKESIMLMEMLKFSKCLIKLRLNQRVQDLILKVIHGNMIKMLLTLVKVLTGPKNQRKEI